MILECRRRGASQALHLHERAAFIAVRPTFSTTSDMAAVNFSAHGARWRVFAITNETMMREYTPPLPGTGLLFTSADGEQRFLAVDTTALMAADALEGKSVAELGRLVQFAQPIN